MAAEIDPPASADCPPHYWLIERSGWRTQHWLCQRCGVVKDAEDTVQLGHRWPKSRSHRIVDSPPTADA
jgi:hypothetical protein